MPSVKQSGQPQLDTDLMPVSNVLVGSQTLLALVQEAVAMLDWPEKEGRFRLDEVQCFPSKTLMVAELYGCAQGAESSEGIAAQAAQDPVLSKLFPDVRPELETISKFRKRYHKEIVRCLQTIFDLALRVRFGEEQTDYAPVDHCVQRALDSWFNPKCGPRPDREARDRIQTISFVDGMSHG